MRPSDCTTKPQREQIGGLVARWLEGFSTRTTRYKPVQLLVDGTSFFPLKPLTRGESLTGFAWHPAEPQSLKPLGSEHTRRITEMNQFEMLSRQFVDDV